jgi:hypothetical protein
MSRDILHVSVGTDSTFHVPMWTLSKRNPWGKGFRRYIYYSPYSVLNTIRFHDGPVKIRAARPRPLNSR